MTLTLGCLWTWAVGGACCTSATGRGCSSAERRTWGVSVSTFNPSPLSRYMHTYRFASVQRRFASVQQRFASVQHVAQRQIFGADVDNVASLHTVKSRYPALLENAKAVALAPVPASAARAHTIMDAVQDFSEGPGGDALGAMVADFMSAEAACHATVAETMLPTAALERALIRRKAAQHAISGSQHWSASVPPHHRLMPLYGRSRCVVSKRVRESERMCERASERETHTERERASERASESEQERQRERERKTERARDRHTEREGGRGRERERTSARERDRASERASERERERERESSVCVCVCVRA